MKEFWLWVVIVSLLIICIMALSFLAVHQTKQLKKTEAILLRAEERDRKQKLVKEPINE
jgi:septation ring formation regulator EzrA